VVERRVEAAQPWALLAYNAACAPPSREVGDRLAVLRGLYGPGYGYAVCSLRHRNKSGDALWCESPDGAAGGRRQGGVASENGDSGRPNFRCLGQVAIGNQRDAELLPGIEEHLVQRVVGRAQLVSQNIDRHAVEDRRDEHKSLAS
jgi:hypothetical protein